MIMIASKMGFAGLLAAVLIGLLEQANPPIDFEAVIVPSGLLIGEQDIALTLRWGIILLGMMLGQWVKRRTREAPEPEGAIDANPT